jgi:hypothetical protein
MQSVKRVNRALYSRVVLHLKTVQLGPGPSTLINSPSNDSSRQELMFVGEEFHFSKDS